ncbi:rhamnogalacturonan lyase [Chitinophagaceae bacterium LB-8]|uniref:Rhamnogalacturonan lyase n=1 Tax=Paraflavisolibacter caeni TaxID=2982496 RepID=A0A9X3B8T1_9BACT|nr:rhamnogalacturonan lyase [Paraflavisolibacter caeni]MCU7551195.1 rhamnogalacturonan lyase [Paraflavisolibacter caeni]
MKLCKLSFPFLAFVLLNTNSVQAQRLMENLSRGLIAVRQDNGKVYVGWRLLASEPGETAFDLYRSANGNTVKLNNKPITNNTNFIDSSANLSLENSYFVKPIVKNKEQAKSNAFIVKANAPAQQYLSVPIQPPPAGEVTGSKYTYTANDASVGDLDGDGEYEIIVKWDPSNSRNPPQTGFTGPQIIDAYKMNGTLLWRINLGKNVRSGAAYTQFLVYDFDGDGKAEMICKTADGTIDGTGKMVGDSSKDWRTYGDSKGAMYGKVANGLEYLTVFNGMTGEAMASAEYVPTRYPLDGWGGIGGNGGNDNSASRSDRFTACVAYLDGKLPSAVMVRGWYGRSVLAAWDWRNGQLTQRWVFDSKDANNPYSGMGNHNLTVADMDEDGKDEICIGAMTVDDDGKGLYTTGLRHGDAIHVSDLDPAHPGLEVFGIHETEEKTEALHTPGVAQFDARTGKILFSLAPGVDVGRGVAADIDPTHEGFENWGGPGGLRDAKGRTISAQTPSSTNFVIWWDDDLTRELLDGNHIDKWNWNSQTTNRLLTAEECASNNGTKATPCLSADLFGDWREEVIWRTKDNKELRIYTTTIPSTHKFYTLMHDPQYRLSIAWQNVSYNQPPHTGFYLGAGMKKAPKPNISFNQSNKSLTKTATTK